MTMGCSPFRFPREISASDPTRVPSGSGGDRRAGGDRMEGGRTGGRAGRLDGGRVGGRGPEGGRRPEGVRAGGRRGAGGRKGEQEGGDRRAGGWAGRRRNTSRSVHGGCVTHCTSGRVHARRVLHSSIAQVTRRSFGKVHIGCVLVVLVIELWHLGAPRIVNVTPKPQWTSGYVTRHVPAHVMTLRCYVKATGGGLSHRKGNASSGPNPKGNLCISEQARRRNSICPVGRSAVVALRCCVNLHPLKESLSEEPVNKSNKPNNRAMST